MFNRISFNLSLDRDHHLITFACMSLLHPRTGERIVASKFNRSHLCDPHLSQQWENFLGVQTTQILNNRMIVLMSTGRPSKVSKVFYKSPWSVTYSVVIKRPRRPPHEGPARVSEKRLLHLCFLSIKIVENKRWFSRVNA